MNQGSKFSTGGGCASASTLATIHAAKISVASGIEIKPRTRLIEKAMRARMYDCDLGPFLKRLLSGAKDMDVIGPAHTLIKNHDIGARKALFPLGAEATAKERGGFIPDFR